MRWLNRRLRSERGASAVLVGLLMVPLLGCLAISIDVGVMYAEHAQLQNGADAAALAIAQDCADGACTDPDAHAENFTKDNANDGAANFSYTLRTDLKKVTVKDSTLTAKGENALQLYFTRFLPSGRTEATVGAEATAVWGPPRKSPIVLPLAISLCEFQPALDGTIVLLRYDQNPACTTPDGHPIPGGFGWLDRVENVCEAAIDLAAGSAPSEPGNSYPGICDDTLTDLEGQTILVPIFDRAYNPTGTEVTSGQAASYRLYAFAAFTVTGWKLSGGHSFPAVNPDTSPGTPNCSGNCRGIQGYFDHWVSVDAAGVELGGPDLGISIAKLSN